MPTDLDTQIWQRHEAACERGDATYEDPATGYQVMTRVGLERRGRCCGSGCRHCPFEHEQVPEARKPSGARWLHGPDSNALGEVDVIFWSGGKDSFSAYLALLDAAARPVVLLTTYDGRSGRVAHQELPIDAVARQAAILNVPALGVPLARGGAYVEQVQRGLSEVTARGTVCRLVFGDLHLEEVRRWRTAMLGPVARAVGATLHFPLWRVDYELLRARLERTNAVFPVCASNVASSLPVAARWSPGGSRALPPGVDAFGEYGEFHTEVTFPDDVASLGGPGTATATDGA